MRTLLALLAWLVALPLAAETRQHGNVIFDLPPGWRVGGTRDDGTLQIYSDLPNDECEYCVIYITPGTKVGGRADTWIASQTRRFIDEEDKPEITNLVKPEVVNLNGRPASMLGQKVDTDLQILFAVQLFGRMELIGFEASAYDEADLAEGMKVFQRDVAPMMDTARFVSEGAEPLMPAPQPGSLSGLYWGYSTGWTMQLDGTMMMQMYHRHLTFWPDGHFYDGTPPQGLAAFDPKTQLDLGDMSWGSYLVEGDKLSLSFASGEVEELSLIDGGGLQNGDRTMYSVEPLGDGSRINGSLYSFFFSGFTPGSGMTGGVSSSNLTSFAPDGTWDGQSTGGAFANFEVAGDLTGGLATGSENASGGTYEVRDGLIIMTHSDGSQPTANLIFKIGEDIMIGDETLGKAE